MTSCTDLDIHIASFVIALVLFLQNKETDPKQHEHQTHSAAKNRTKQILSYNLENDSTYGANNNKQITAPSPGFVADKAEPNESRVRIYRRYAHQA